MLLLSHCVIVIINALCICAGSGVDIYVFAEGMQYDHKAFGGRASNGGFAPDKGCTRIGTELASLAAGKFVGVATEANVYRYLLYKWQFMHI